MGALGWSESQFSAQSAGGGVVAAMLTRGATRSAVQGVTRQAARISPQVAVGPTTEPCVISGTVILSGNVANPPDLGPGDTLNASFTDCDDGDSLILNGGLKLQITSISGDVIAGSFRVVADTTFTNLGVTEGSDTGTLNGTASLTFDALDPSKEITRIVADSLRFTSGGDVFQLTDYDLSAEVLLGPNQYSLHVTGLLQDTSAFAGTVQIDTLTAVTGDVGSYPSAGLVRVTGASAGTVDVEALNPIQVRLHIDADGNGMVDEVRDLTWVELAGVT